MFTGFNLKIDKDIANIMLDLDKYSNIGRDIYKDYALNVRKNLEEYICNNMKRLNGSQIQEDWFPQVKADIFLSHSHDDEKWIIGLAGWIYEKFGLVSFIDSCIWGYSNNLLKDIDDRYSIFDEDSEGNTYYYDKCCKSSSHVHMMLSMALFKMIDKTECLFFINTPSSIDVTSSIENNEKTLSPWIYAEIEMSNLVRKKELIEYRKKNLPVFENVMKHNLEIEYGVSLKHLVEIDEFSLLSWEKEYSKDNRGYFRKALDYLYINEGVINITGEE